MSTIQEYIMSRLVMGGIAALVLLVSAKIPVAGIVAIEKKLDVYPIISHEIVESMEELTSAYTEFGLACYCYKSGAGVSLSGESCEGIANESALDEAKDNRKAAAANLDPSLITAVALGVNYHTHSSWECSGSSDDPKVNVDLGITATYELLRDNKRELVLTNPT